LPCGFPVIPKGYVNRKDGQMDDGDPITAAFPRQARAISARRRVDSDFDEICVDFETLHRSIPADALHHRDALATLDALKSEIEAALASAVRGSRGS
jgi:hypothetical protein